MTFSQFLLHRNRIERDRPGQRAATSPTLSEMKQFETDPSASGVRQHRKPQVATVVRCNPRREPTVDDWQAERVAQIGLDADRRRDEHRSEGAAAIARIKGRGESIASIAATQALGGEQAEEHGGGSAPIGDAGDVDAPVV